MVSIILAWSDEQKKKAVGMGFREQTVLLRFDPVMSTSKEKARLTRGIVRGIRPYQFLVADFWGMDPD